MKKLIKNLNLLIAIFVITVFNISAQCPAHIQDQGNNNSNSVVLSFKNEAGTVIGTCNCSVAGNSGNLNCPGNCPYDIPGTGFSTISMSYPGGAAGNYCLYTPAGILITGLSIELINFTATAISNYVALDWETASETDNHFFTIEKTTDLVSFETVAEVKGAGNSDSPSKYSAIDFQPYQGTSYYRLKQTDYDGQFIYSDYIVVAYNSTSNFNLNVFPNPGTKESINYSLKGSKGQEITVTLNDITGREVYYSTILLEDAREVNFQLDPSSKLLSGVYAITATSEDKVVSKRLVIQ